MGASSIHTTSRTVTVRVVDPPLPPTPQPDDNGPTRILPDDNGPTRFLRS